jgi:hypothetical protein
MQPRHALTMAGLLLSAGVAAGCANHPVGRVATRAPAAIPTTAAPTTAAPTPACTARDVSARFDGDNGAGGHLLHYVRFRNTSPAPCVLRGYPHVVASAPGRPDVTGSNGGSFRNGRSPDLAPGDEALLAMVTATYCDRRPGGGGPRSPYRRFTITLPGGGTVTVRQSGADALDLTCGMQVTTFWVN